MRVLAQVIGTAGAQTSGLSASLYRRRIGCFDNYNAKLYLHANFSA